MSDRLELEKVAGRYAKALFDVAATDEERHAIRNDLTLLQSIVDQTPELMPYLSNPAVLVSAKQAFLHQHLGDSFNPRVIKMLKLLLENNRLLVFPHLVSSFKHWINQADQRAEAEVVSAVPIEQPLQDRISQVLASLFGFKHVELKTQVDPRLLGGLTIKIQDQVIDGSYMGRLEAIRKHIHQF